MIHKIIVMNNEQLGPNVNKVFSVKIPHGVSKIGCIYRSDKTPLNYCSVLYSYSPGSLHFLERQDTINQSNHMTSALNLLYVKLSGHNNNIRISITGHATEIATIYYEITYSVD